MKAVIFDIDGTLSIVGDRVKYLQQEPKNWDAFYEACDEDIPNHPIVKLQSIMMCSGRYFGYVYILLTGRRESVRAKTAMWLAHNRITYDKLLMRPDGDFRHDTVLKPGLIAPLGITEAIIFEDRDSMVKKWREMGYTCLQVADGNF